MVKKRNIVVFTGSRADYGILLPLLKAIQKDPVLDLKLVVSGTHLLPEFGLTVRDIENEGFRIDEKIEIVVGSDSPNAICKSMGLAFIQFGDTFKRVGSDIIVLLGDRYETFCAAGCALMNNIPVAHIHGGELSSGAVDDSLRHAISKMSHIHFTSSEVYRRRVIQLGEQPENVHNVGSLAVEKIKLSSTGSPKEFFQFLGFSQSTKFFLVTYHPETIRPSHTYNDFKSVLNALSKKEFSDYYIVFTKANSDSSGRGINQMIEAFINRNSQRSILFSSMGHQNYITALKYASAMVGNSSSGIIEAPSFKLPVVNIGERQLGRLRAENVIDCRPVEEEIVHAIQKGLSKEFHLEISRMVNPFEQENTSLKIVSILASAEIENICEKKFHDC